MEIVTIGIFSVPKNFVMEMFSLFQNLIDHKRMLQQKIFVKNRENLWYFKYLTNLVLAIFCSSSKLKQLLTYFDAKKLKKIKYENY